MSARVLGIVFTALLLVCVPISRAHAASYVVQPGDTLSGIAANANVSVASLAAANGLSDLNYVRAGMTLVIPEMAAGTAPGIGTYLVQPGDTLSGLAARFGVSIATLRSLNPALGTYPLIGELLQTCQSCAGASAAPESSSATDYVVQQGDNLTSIATRFGVSLGDLLSANRLADANMILIGTHIAIPSVQSASYPSTVDAQGLITSYSNSYGVDPALALGISWQESGFNQAEVSATGAIGVMQVEPSTGAVASRLLGRSLNLYSLNDNIEAGVYWLSYLLQYYGGDVNSAIAAYYQGTQSIADHGLFSDTIQYVRNVLALEARFGG